MWKYEGKAIGGIAPTRDRVAKRKVDVPTFGACSAPLELHGKLH